MPPRKKAAAKKKTPPPSAAEEEEEKEDDSKMMMDDDDAIDDALDGDNPKAALIDLLVEREASRGPTERVLSTLEDSGDDSAEMLSGVLDHAIELLEQVSMNDHNYHFHLCL